MCPVGTSHRPSHAQSEVERRDGKVDRRTEGERREREGYKDMEKVGRVKKKVKMEEKEMIESN